MQLARFDATETDPIGSRTAKASISKPWSLICAAEKFALIHGVEMWKRERADRRAHRHTHTASQWPAPNIPCYLADYVRSLSAPDLCLLMLPLHRAIGVSYSFRQLHLPSSALLKSDDAHLEGCCFAFRFRSLSFSLYLSLSFEYFFIHGMLQTTLVSKRGEGLW